MSPNEYSSAPVNSFTRASTRVETSRVRSPASYLREDGRGRVGVRSSVFAFEFGFEPVATYSSLPQKSATVDLTRLSTSTERSPAEYSSLPVSLHTSSLATWSITAV
eukprot:6110229-Prymnesium_polylepis.1